jgi:hypothetical protein
VGDKGEGSSFWLSVLEDIQARGVKVDCTPKFSHLYVGSLIH